MIHFQAVQEPEGWAAVKKEADAWLEDHPDAQRPRDYWSAFITVLAEGFGYLCGYSALFDPAGTVDHFVPSGQPYDWSNYRYATGWINSKKRAAIVLDPFKVQDEWFELQFPSLQLKLSDKIPPDQKDLAEFTLKRLNLVDDERLIKCRAEWLRMYQEKELTLEGLEKKAPLVARALRRQSDAS